MHTKPPHWPFCMMEPGESFYVPCPLYRIREGLNQLYRAWDAWRWASGCSARYTWHRTRSGLRVWRVS